MMQDEWIDVPDDFQLPQAQPSFADQYASAVMRQESAFNPRAVSSAGAQGLMQIMPATGREVAQKLGMQNFDPFNAEQNQIVGKAYLNQMYEQFQDPQLALAAYNAGPGRVQQAIQRAGTKDPNAVLQFLPRETQDYVPKVQGNLQSNYGAPNIQQQPKLTAQNVVKDEWVDAPEDEWIDVPEDQPEMSWKDYARGIVGQGVQGLTFNFGDELGLVDPERAKQFEAQYPKAAIGSQIAGGLAPAAVSYVASLFSGGAAAPAAAATTASTAANVSRLASLLKGGARVAAGMGPKTAATTGLGRAAQGVGYGALYGGLSGAGEGENAGEKIAGAIRGSAFGGVAGGALSGLTGALTKTKGPDLSEGDKLLIKRLRSVPDDVIQGAETTLRQADQPIFLPEAIGTEDFYRSSKAIANAADTKDIAQALIKSRYEGQPARLDSVIDEVSPVRNSFEAGKAIQDRANAVIDAETQARDDMAQELFGQAYKKPPVNDAYDVALNRDMRLTIDDLFSGDIPQSGNSKFNEVMNSEIVQPIIKRIKKFPDYKELRDDDPRMVQKVLEEITSEMQSGNIGSLARDYGKLKDTIYSTLETANPELIKARNTFRIDSEKITALKDLGLGKFANKNEFDVTKFGKELLNPKTPAEKIKAVSKALGDDGDELISAALRSELSDQVANRVGGRNTISIFDKQALKDRLIDVLGESKASKIIKKIDEEALITEGTQKYNLGSKTEANLSDSLAEDFFRDPLKYYGRKPAQFIGDGLSYALGKFINPSRQALQDEASIVFSNSKAADALTKALQSRSAQRQSQQSYESLAPLIHGLSRNANEIPVIEIKNSYKRNK